jgi:hypothetical protein
MTTNVQQISDAGYAAALAAGRIEAETEIRAQAVGGLNGSAKHSS